jgi:hypothetical protein
MRLEGIRNGGAYAVDRDGERHGFQRTGTLAMRYSRVLLRPRNDGPRRVPVADAHNRRRSCRTSVHPELQDTCESLCCPRNRPNTMKCRSSRATGAMIVAKVSKETTGNSSASATSPPRWSGSHRGRIAPCRTEELAEFRYGFICRGMASTGERR